ncbi:MAG TPA: GrpB family protein [Actinokineospora sp.]|jgi:GrpB-like predicted nucleotidyltransferase (UPF0157 family)|nr:GrpB family protein [Actinokineospora sp.]
MPTPEEITRHHEPDPDENPWVDGPPRAKPFVIAEYDERWRESFALLKGMIKDVLGDTALVIEHVGSTSVPGLAAKPIIDIDLTVPDSADEAAYVPALEAAGFRLAIREPSWHEHRCLKLAAPDTNLHVFSPDCPETVRHRMFRDWLIAHPEDLARYREAKHAAAVETTAAAGVIVDYNRHKEPVLRDIYDRMFRAAGLL